MSKTVQVVIWSDFVCPWCWIAKRRLEKAVAELAGQVEVTVTTKSYRLANAIANGVPLFVFNDKSYVSGAQPASVFKKALIDAAVDAPEAFDAGEGAVCTIDGCAG